HMGAAARERHPCARVPGAPAGRVRAPNRRTRTDALRRRAMIRGRRGSAGITIALLLAAAVIAGCSRDKGARPNIIVIVMDTQRADRLGFYGRPPPTTFLRT